MAYGFGIHEWDTIQDKDERKEYAKAWLDTMNKTNDSKLADAAGHDALTALRSNMAMPTSETAQTPKLMMTPRYQRWKIPFTGQEVQSWFKEPETPSMMTDQDKANLEYKPSDLTGIDYVKTLNKDDKKIYSDAYYGFLRDSNDLDAAENAGKLAVETGKKAAQLKSERTKIFENNELRSDIENAMTIDAFNTMDPEDQDIVIAAWQNAPTQPNLQTGEQVRAGIGAIFGALQEIGADTKYGINVGGWNNNPQPIQKQNPPIDYSTKERHYVKTEPVTPVEKHKSNIESIDNRITQLEDLRQSIIQENAQIDLGMSELSDEEAALKRNENLKRKIEIENELAELEKNKAESEAAFKEESEKGMWYYDALQQYEKQAKKVEELKRQKEAGFYDVQDELEAAEAELRRIAEEGFSQANDISNARQKAGLDVLVNSIKNAYYSARAGLANEIATRITAGAAFLGEDYDYRKDPYALQELKDEMDKWKSMDLSEEEIALLEEDFWADIANQTGNIVGKLNEYASYFDAIRNDQQLRSDTFAQKAVEAGIQMASEMWKDGEYENYNDVEKLKNILNTIEVKGFQGTAFQFGSQLDTLLLSFFGKGEKAVEGGSKLLGRIKNLLTDRTFYGSVIREWSHDRAEAYLNHEELTDIDKSILLTRALLKGAIEIGFGGEGGGVESYWAGRTVNVIKSGAEEAGEEFKQDFVDWAGINLGHLLQGRNEMLLPVYSPDIKDNALFNLEKDTELFVGTFVQTLGMDAMRLPINAMAKAMCGIKLSQTEQIEVDQAKKLVSEALAAQEEHQEFEAAANHEETKEQTEQPEPERKYVKTQPAPADQASEEAAQPLKENEMLPPTEQKAEEASGSEQKAEQTEAKAEQKEEDKTPSIEELEKKTREYADKYTPYEQIRKDVMASADLEGPSMYDLQKQLEANMNETPEGRLQLMLNRMDEQQLMDVANGAGEYANGSPEQKQAARKMLNEKRKRFAKEHAKLDDVESEILARMRERRGDINTEKNTGVKYLETLDDAELEELRKELSGTEELDPDITENDINMAIANRYTGDDRMTDARLRGMPLSKLQRLLEQRKQQNQQPAKEEASPASPNATGDGVTAEEAGKDTTKKEAPAGETAEQEEPEINVFKNLDTQTLEIVLTQYPEDSQNYKMVKAELENRGVKTEEQPRQKLADELAVKEVGDEVQKRNIVNELQQEQKTEQAETREAQAAEKEAVQGKENAARNEETPPEVTENNREQADNEERNLQEIVPENKAEQAETKEAQAAEKQAEEGRENARQDNEKAPEPLPNRGTGNKEGEATPGEESAKQQTPPRKFEKMTKLSDAGDAVKAQQTEEKTEQPAQQQNQQKKFEKMTKLYDAGDEKGGASEQQNEEQQPQPQQPRREQEPVEAIKEVGDESKVKEPETEPKQEQEPETTEEPYKEPEDTKEEPVNTEETEKTETEEEDLPKTDEQIEKETEDKPY